VGLADLQVASSFDGQREAQNATWLQFFLAKFRLQEVWSKDRFVGKIGITHKNI
jgi:hypothetical protein